MPKLTARDMLHKIDQFLATAPGLEASKLWDIMSALRGPDSGLHNLKWATTSVIRARALPAASKGWLLLKVEVNTQDSLQEALKMAEVADTHFERHAMAAIKALMALDIEEERHEQTKADL